MQPTLLALIAQQRLADLYADADNERLARDARVTTQGTRADDPPRRDARGRAGWLRRLVRSVRPVRPAAAG